MGTPVLILGTSGTGKSASMRNLAPDRFNLINVAKKPLPFRSTKKPLNTDSYADITAALGRAPSDIIVIDDVQYLLINEQLRRLSEKGYEKFTEIAFHFWSLFQQAIALPPEKIVYFMGHTETDSMGNVKLKTVGKMLDEKINVEGMCTIVLRTHVQDGRFYFSTLNDGTDTVKTPIGMFAEPYIDNDLAFVDAAIRDYYGLVAAPIVPASKPVEAKGARRENSLV